MRREDARRRSERRIRCPIRGPRRGRRGEPIGSRTTRSEHRPSNSGGRARTGRCGSIRRGSPATRRPRPPRRAAAPVRAASTLDIRHRRHRAINETPDASRRITETADPRVPGLVCPEHARKTSNNWRHHLKGAVRRLSTSFFMLLTITATLHAQDLASFEKRTTVRKLDNGLTVIVMERPEAAVFSFTSVVNVGSAQEVPGITGLAHMFEHMAFKGTDKVGTSNYTAESAALAKVEEAYTAYDRARRDPVTHDEAKIAALDKAWKAAIDDAQKYVVPNEFSKVVDRAGAVGVNAFTNDDSTVYFYSLPSNRVELWAYLDSERFLHPVFREFYKEREVVHEERRMRTESSPFGRLFEQALGAAFMAHPYGQPVVGWPSDLESFSATDAVAFFKKNYVPANMVIAVVGDVK